MIPKFLVWVMTLILLCCLGGCDEATPQGTLPPVSWEGQNIIFATSYDSLPCGDTLSILDARVDEIQDQLGSFLPESKKITYYFLDSEDMRLTPCQNATGCTDGGTTVYSQLPIHTHELVHAILSPLGRSHVFWEEGIASVFNDGGVLPPMDCNNTGACEAGKQYLLGVLNDPPPTADLDYSGLGHFTRYLLDTIGSEKLMEIYRDSQWGSNYADLQSVFESTVGQSIESILDEWVNESEPDYGELLECSICTDVELTQIGDTVTGETVFHLACNGDTPVWQYGGYTIFSGANMVITFDGEYRFELDSDAESVDVFFLAEDAWFDLSYDNTLQQNPDRHLTSGRYRILARKWSENIFQVDTLLKISINLINN